MICCSRRPTRLIGWSMHCTSRVAQGMRPVRWAALRIPLRTLNSSLCRCSCIRSAKSTEIG